MHSLNSVMSVDRSAGRDFAPARRNCARRAFGTSLSLLGPTLGPVAPDLKDSYLLALAEASQTEFLVTGDKELPSLK